MDVGAVIDNEPVVVGKAACFVGATVDNAGTFKFVACAHGGMDVLIGLAKRAVGGAAGMWVDSCVMTWSADLDFH